MNYNLIINPSFGIQFFIFLTLIILLIYISYRFFKSGKIGITLGVRTFGNITWMLFDGIKTLEDLKRNHSSRFFRVVYIGYPKTFLYGFFFLTIAMLIFLLLFLEIRSS